MWTPGFRRLAVLGGERLSATCCRAAYSQGESTYEAEIRAPPAKDGERR